MGSVWKQSGECRFYRTRCSGEASKSSGWYAAGAVKSCDDACGAQGLFCNEAELHAHNNEVDSSAELLALIKKLVVRSTLLNVRATMVTIQVCPTSAHRQTY